MKYLISTSLIALTFFASSCGSVKDVSTPEFRDISEVRLINLGLLETTAGADMVFYNPNGFTIGLSDARGDVYIDNSYLGHFELDQSVQVKRHAEFVLPVTFKLDNIGVIKNQEELRKKRDALVRIEGSAILRKAGFSKEVPIRYEHVESIDRLRTLVSSR